jgi:hypothetical protein
MKALRRGVEEVRASSARPAVGPRRRSASESSGRQAAGILRRWSGELGVAVAGWVFRRRPPSRRAVSPSPSACRSSTTFARRELQSPSRLGRLCRAERGRLLLRCSADVSPFARPASTCWDERAFRPPARRFQIFTMISPIAHFKGLLFVLYFAQSA